MKHKTPPTQYCRECQRPMDFMFETSTVKDVSFWECKPCDTRLHLGKTHEIWAFHKTKGILKIARPNDE